MGKSNFSSRARALRDIMFHEKVEANNINSARNHTFRAVDWTWRCEADWRQGSETNDGRLKEVILVASAARADGTLDGLQDGNNPTLPTYLWLGELPGTPIAGQTRKVKGPDGKIDEVQVFEQRPPMLGNLAQETFVRVILPVAPASKGK